MGPASDLRQKECPRLLRRPAPLAAHHSQCRGFVFTFQTSLAGAKATDEHTETCPGLTTTTTLFHYSGMVFIGFKKSHSKTVSHRASLLSRPRVMVFFLSHSSRLPKMLIAPQSQSLKSRTYCADSILWLLQPFMWVLMYCHLPSIVTLTVCAA